MVERNEARAVVMSEAPAWPIAGHDAAVALLQRALAAGHIAHAYLITGPEAVGRATLARLFATALVCQAPVETARPLAPCGACRACLKVARGVHPDVEVLSLETQQAASEGRGAKNRNITIESIRAMRERLALRPLEAAWRVVIIEDAETMSGGGGLPAASALLKTLEEPPPYAVIMLIAPDVEAVLPTLVSRCQVISLATVGRAAIAAHLETHHGQPPEQAERLAVAAQGRPGRALAALHEPALLEAHQTRLQRALEFMQADRFGRLVAADEWAGRFSRADWRQAELDLEVLTSCWRDLLLVHTGCEVLAANQEVLPLLRGLAGRLSLAQIADALAAVRTCGLQVRQNVSPRLALEAMVLRWPSLAP